MPAVPSRVFPLLLVIALTFWISCSRPTPASPGDPSVGTWILSSESTYAVGQLELHQDGTCAYRFDDHWHSCAWTPHARGRFDLRYGRYLAVNHASGEAEGDLLTLDHAHGPEPGALHRIRSRLDQIDALYHQGRDLIDAGEVDGGVARWQEAAELGSAGVQNNLAWLLATSKDPKRLDGKRAVAMAEKAVAANRKSTYLDTLAAALARDGQYERAVTIEKEALSLLQKEPGHDAADPDGTVGRFRHRLGLYQAGQPYTEP